MKKEGTLKLKKGGLDTIVAYIVVMLPLFYVLVYIIATIYHFSVQQYMNQVVKEACVMASTYGTITTKHTDYIYGKLAKISSDKSESKAREEFYVTYYIRSFRYEGDNAGTVGPLQPLTSFDSSIKKGDIIGIYVQSKNPSLLGTVGDFNVFMVGRNGDRDKLLKYTAYREEIIRNDKP